MMPWQGDIEFYNAIGRIVVVHGRLTVIEWWYMLDTVADLLTMHARTRIAHRKELNETIRDAGRDASAAYAEGKWQAAAEREPW